METFETESRVVEGKSRPLPTIKECNKRFPRKLKKKLKKEKGEQGYIDWLNERIKYVVGEPIICYNEDAKDELTQMLIKEITEKL